MADRTSNIPNGAYQGQPQPRGQGQQGEKKQGEIYLNVGVVGADGMLYTLPLGLNIDLMNPSANRNANPIIAAQNKLLADLVAMGQNLPKGEAMQLNLVVELRRRAEAVEAKVEESLLPSLSTLVVGAPALRASAANRELVQDQPLPEAVAPAAPRRETITIRH